MRKTRVLFLSTSNAGRSQMSEAFLRKYGGECFEAYSAGLEPTEINPDVRTVLEEVGVPLDGQWAKDVSEYMGKLHFGYTISVCADAERNCPSVFPGVGERLHWAFDGLSAGDEAPEARLEKSRRVRDEIDARIQAWVAEVNAPDAFKVRP